MEEPERRQTHLDIRGGGQTFWASLRLPLVRLTADNDGIVVAIRGGMRRATTIYLPPEVAAHAGDPKLIWSSPWAEVERAIAAKRSVVMWRRGGAYCRFVAFRRKDFRPLIAVLESHGVEIVSVWTTILSGRFRRDSPSTAG